MLASWVMGWVNDAHVLDEGLDVADGDGVLDGQVAAQDADRHIAQVADEGHDRHHHAGQELRFPGRAVERVVVAVELSRRSWPRR